MIDMKRGSMLREAVKEGLVLQCQERGGDKGESSCRISKKPGEKHRQSIWL
jgi:hypothetical protein